ncbi:MAG: hypothetical protein ABW352_20885 [Polyangiales bacterium]
MRHTWLLLVLLGCSDDDAPVPGRDLDSGRADASLDAGGRSLDSGDTRDLDAGTCTLVGQVASRVGAGAADCGTLSLNPATGDGETAYRAVRACVLEALASGAPFHAIKQEQGIDSLVTSAFVRERQGGDVGLLYGDQGFGSATVFEQRCATLRETTRCEPAQRQLCLTCEGTTEPKLLCRSR